MGSLEGRSIAVLTLLGMLGIFQQSAAADDRAAPLECSQNVQDRIGTLSGTVSDVSRTGISGALITASCGSFLQAVSTDSTGAYSLQLSPGEPSLALSQLWRKNGGHRATYACPDPTPFSPLARRSRCMTLQLRSLSLGASHHLQAWCALVVLTKLLASNFRTQTTIEPIRPALRLAPPSIPQVLLITVRHIEFP
jgi:hypothetical protein